MQFRFLFLPDEDPERVAQHVAGAERIPLSEQTLRMRLNERGLLASIDQARATLKVRRIIEGASREVLHLRAKDVLGAALERRVA